MNASGRDEVQSDSLDFLRAHLEQTVLLLLREYCHTWSWVYPIDYLSRLSLPVDEILQEKASLTSEFTLYVHVPFCSQKCDFCQFYRPGNIDKFGSRRYVDCLKAELRACLTANPARRALSVYVGGGTPTLLAPEDLKEMLLYIRKHLPLDPDAEVTVETEPHCIDRPMAQALAAGGATEIVFGVQSFNEDKLKGINRRKQTNGHVREAARLLRESGRFKIAFDLIYGLADGEDSDEFLKDNLDHIVELKPDVVVVHPLQNYRKLPSTLKEFPIVNLDRIYSEIGSRLPQSTPYHSQYFYYRFVTARDVLAIGLGGGGTFFVDGNYIRRTSVHSRSNDYEGYAADASEGRFRYRYWGQTAEEGLRWYLMFNLHRAYGVDEAVARARFPTASTLLEDLLVGLGDALIRADGRIRLRADFAQRLPFKTDNDQINYFIFSFCHLYSEDVRRKMIDHLRDKFAPATASGLAAG